MLTDPSESPTYESEEVEIKSQHTEDPSDTPRHGDKKDGMIYINGFGWVVENGGGSTSEYAEGMDENGNKMTWCSLLRMMHNTNFRLNRKLV